MATIVAAGLLERLLGAILPAPVRSSGALLIASNLVPLYGVLAWDWPIFHVMALYWAENVIAGVVTLLRMLRASPTGGIFMGAFFCVHYGMFCFVHGVFVGSLFGPGALDAFQLQPLTRAFASEPELLAATVLLFISHGWSFVAHGSLGTTGARPLAAIMMRPYKRMVALHVGLIFGGWIIMGLDTPLLAMVPLIVVKTAIDLTLHNRANRPVASSADGMPMSAEISP